MSRINRMRFINLEYGDMHNVMTNETLTLNGLDTLFCMDNTVGKTTLIQLILGNYISSNKQRSTKTSKYSRFFNTKRPTIVMTEWVLDNGECVLVGSFGRIAPKVSAQTSSEFTLEEEPDNDSNMDSLEQYMFIIDKKIQKDFPYDIDTIPFIVRNEESTVSRMSFSDIEKFLKEKNITIYNYNSPSANNRYFDKLREYKIYKEIFENYLSKINFVYGEGGIQGFFETNGGKETNQNKQDFLIEKFLLPLVCDKMGRDKISGFQELFLHASKSYAMQEKTVREEQDIRQFLDSNNNMKEHLDNFFALVEKYQESMEKINGFYIHAKERKDRELIQKRENIILLSEKQKEKNKFNAMKLSKQVNDLEEEICKCEADINSKVLLIQSLETKKEECEKTLSLLECKKTYDFYRNLEREYQAIVSEYKIINGSLNDKEIPSLGKFLYLYSVGKKEETLSLKEKTLTKLNEQRKEQENKEKNLIELEEALSDCDKKIGKYEALILETDKNIKKYNNKYDCDLISSVFCKTRLEEYRIMHDSLEKEIFELMESIQKEKNAISELSDLLKKEEIEKINLTHELDSKKKEIEKAENLISTRKNCLKELSFSEELLFDDEGFLATVLSKEKDIIAQNELLLKEKAFHEKTLLNLKQGILFDIPEKVKHFLNTNGIEWISGFEWLKKNNTSMEQKKEIIKEFPLLPFSIVTISPFDRSILEGHSDLDSIIAPISVISMEDIRNKGFSFTKSDEFFSELGKMSVLSHFPNDILNETEFASFIFNLEEEIKDINDTIENNKLMLDNYSQIRNKWLKETLTKTSYELLKDEFSTVNDLLLQLAKKIEEQLLLQTDKKTALKSSEELLTRKQIVLSEQKILLEETSLLLETLKEKEEAFSKKKDFEEERLKTKNQISFEKTALEKLQRVILENEKDKLVSLNEEISALSEDIAVKYSAFKDVDISQEKTLLEKKGYEIVKAEYDSLTSAISANIEQIKEKMDKKRADVDSIKTELEQENRKWQFSDEELENCTFSHEKKHSIEEEKENIIVNITKENKNIDEQNKKIRNNEENKKKLLEDLWKNPDYSELMSPESYQDISIELCLCNITEDIKAIIDKDKKSEENINKLDLMISVLLEKTRLFTSLKQKDQEGYDFPSFEDDISLWDDLYEMLLLSCNSFEEEYNKAKKTIMDFFTKIKHDYLDNKLFSPITNKFVDELNGDSFCFRENYLMTMKSLEDKYVILKNELSQVEEEIDTIIFQMTQYARDIISQFENIDDTSVITSTDNKTKKMLEICFDNVLKSEDYLKRRSEDWVRKEIVAFSKFINEGKMTENDLRKEVQKLSISKIFDGIIGKQNVKFQTYKVDSTGTFTKMSWNDAYNSSSDAQRNILSFTIMFCMLSYMYKDIENSFSTQHYGKVLILDNPFAKIVNGKMLSVISKLAQKNDVQLMFFTGINDANINDLFPLIIEMNIVDDKTKTSGRRISCKQKMKELVLEGKRDVNSIKIVSQEQLSLF